MITHLKKVLFVGISQEEIEEAELTGVHASGIENGGKVRLLASELVSGVVPTDQVLDDPTLKGKLRALRVYGMFAAIVHFPDVDLHADLARLKEVGKVTGGIVLHQDAIFGPPNDSSENYQKIIANVS